MTLKDIYDWVHKDGEPSFNTHDVNTLLLLDIAMSMRNLVKMSAESMEMNKVILASLDADENESMN